MGYLLTKTFVFMLGAFLLGLLLGWLIWGRLKADLDAARAERDRLKGDLDNCGRARTDLERRLREAEANAVNERSRLTAEIEAVTKAKAEARVPAAAPAALMAAPKAKVALAVKRAAVPAKSATTPAAPKATAAKKALVAKAPDTAPAALTAAPKAKAAPVVKKAAAPAKSATAPAAPKATASKKVPVAKAKVAPAPKKAAATVPDDLRLILGIGRTNEKKLHEAGVTTYAQIAAWKEADVKRIGAVINFGERIVKERWVEQATLLAKGDMDAFYKAFPAAKEESNT